MSARHGEVTRDSAGEVTPTMVNGQWSTVRERLSPSTSAADDAQAPPRSRAVDGERETPRLDQVLGVLRGSALEVKPAGIDEVLARYPAANALEAAHTVMAWLHGGRARTRVAHRMLDAALGSQPRRLATQPELAVVGPPPRDPETWAPIAAALRAAVPDFKFHIWLEPLELVMRDGGRLVVAAPEYIRTSVQERYAPLVRRLASEALAEPVYVEIVGTDWRPE